MNKNEQDMLEDIDKEVNGEESSLETKKLTSWKNEPSFDDLHADYIAAQTDHGDYLAKLEVIRKNFEGGEEILAMPGKSTSKPKLIRKQAEWKYPAMSEPFLNTEKMFNVSPRSSDDMNAAKQNADILNYQWGTKIDKTSVIDRIVKTIVDEGTCVVKTGWEIDQDEIDVVEMRPTYMSAEESIQALQAGMSDGSITPEQGQEIMQSGQPLQNGEEEFTSKKKVYVKNQPTYEICNNENVIIDPTANGDRDQIRFIIHEYETDFSELVKE